MSQEFETRLAKDVDPEWLEGRPVFIHTGEAEGAIPNGTRVEKCNTEPGDSFPDGTQGTVFSSVYDETEGYGYFVFFDGYKGIPVVIRGRRIRPL